jgi:hypothetical protein
MNWPKLAAWQYLMAIVLVIVLVLILALGIQNFVREAIVIPLSYIFWVGNIFFKTVPQGAFLGLLVLLILYVGLRSLSPEKKARGEDQPYELRMPVRARVSFWSLQVRMLRGSNYARDRFSQFLTKLVVDVLAHEQQLTRLQLEDAIEEGKLDIPTEMKLFLTRRQQPTSSGSRGLLAWLGRLLTQLWQKAWYHPSSVQTSLEYAYLEKIILYLEKQLEIKHE